MFHKTGLFTFTAKRTSNLKIQFDLTVGYLLSGALKSVGKSKEKSTHPCECYPTCESDEYAIEEIKISKGCVLTDSKSGDTI